MVTWGRVLALALALSGCPGASHGRATAPKQVLVIYPDGTNGTPGGVVIDRALRSAFSRASVEVTNEFVDTSRLGDRAFRGAQLGFLRQKYSGRTFDLVIAGLTPSLDFALSCRSELFPGVPVVYMAVDERELRARRLPADVIGVPMKMDLTGTLELALGLHPQTRRVFVVSGAADVDAESDAEARRVFAARRDALEYVHLHGLKMDELLARVGSLPDRSVIFYLHVRRDGDGISRVPAVVLGDLAAAANAPIYGMADTYVGRGCVGGRVFRFEACGESAAALALRILEGEKPDAISTARTQETSAVFDWRQLRRWNIDEHRLPPGSVVLNREESVWRAYRWHLAGGAAVVAVESLLIAGLWIQLRRRKRAEAERETLHREAAASQNVLALLSRRLMEAQELERRHIARELHDEIGQLLTTIKVQLELLRGAVHTGSTDQLAGCLNAVDSVIEHVRGLSLNLCPPSLEVVGLENALRAHLDRQAAQAHIEVELDSNLSGERLPPAQEIVCFRVAQEGLTNTLRHARARSFKVALSRIDDVVHVTIQDDGEGFDVGAAERGILEGRGFGLTSMKERVHLAGGRIRIESSPGHGTRIDVSFPVPRKPRAEPA